MAKGVSKIFVPDTLTNGALFLSQLRTQKATEGKAAAEIFEIYLPTQGVVELTVKAPAKVSVRPKAKTSIVLINPYFVVSNKVTGAEGNKRAKVGYVLHCEGFELKGEQ